MQADEDLALIVSAAKEAGEIALSYWKTDHKAWDKADNAGLVTEADLAVDAMLKDRLLAARPDYGWLSEETEDNPDRLTKERVFIVDPIDGTRSFAAGESTWAHSIAIVENGVPIAGVVFLPARGKTYSASKSEAFLNDSSIRPTKREGLDGAAFLCARSVLEPRMWQGRAPAISRQFRPSLAYRMGLVAEGRFDAMITMWPAWEWDIAAGALLVEAAGGRVTDAQGQRIKFNAHHAKSQGVICAGVETHALIGQQLIS